MPGIQQWLNAWVKVNSKQQGSGPSAGPSGSTNGAPRLPQAKETRSGTSTRNRSSSIGSASERKSGETRVRGISSTSSQKRSDKLQFSSGFNSIGEVTRATDATAALSTTVASITSIEETDNQGNPEHDAIRKHSRKHKRRLNRTNSFSDLLREKAKHRSSRSNGRHYSVERPHYAGPGEVSQQAAGRHNRSRRRSHRRSNPPPPTLHHPMVEPPPDEDLSSHASSNHSVSPTETATTVLRSNAASSAKPRYHSQRSIEEQSIDSSNSALFGVADFFGTDISELRERPTTASTGARHQTHKAQHGLEDEIPHYLRPYIDSTESSNEPQDTIHLPTQTQQHHSRYRSQSPTYNNNNNTHYNLHHQATTATSATSTLQNNNRLLIYDSKNNAHPQFTDVEDAPRKANNVAYLQPLASRNPTTSGEKEPTRLTQPATNEGFVMGGVRLPFYTTNAPRAAVATIKTNKGPNATTTNSNDKDNSDASPMEISNCPSCQLAQLELKRTQESLEYMRTMAIRKELTCHKCGSKTKRDQDKSSSNDDEGPDESVNASRAPNTDGHNNIDEQHTGKKIRSAVVKKSSEQLVEVTGRHKKQVEQLMKERNHWQHNMHLKLEKFSNLCHNLNDQSSLRVEEAKELKEELAAMRAERDQMASELGPLRTAVKEFEREREEHRLLKERMARNESEGLRQANAAIAQRDDMIAKLSSKLETALDTLAVEREQQRQRRQIIFPQQYTNGRNGLVPANGQASHGEGMPARLSANNNVDNSAQSGELESLRAQLLEAQQKLETVQLEADQKETALRFRCETLENQIKENNTATDLSSKKPHEPHHLFS
ncbi:expressed unknown protein [Seminavis robusta]|uniref:Uncharacterized protein n=1 Tax=Seminavis robusta TaxID=568900 RepID=A0A9N8EL01_9STRA|nr:expressed unknown protein [Seminavis robusta]|eukprot:Sro1101_g241470.1 n/a (831) ;mRNA; r:28738-31331